jgi:hypothetical protein
MATMSSKMRSAVPALAAGVSRGCGAPNVLWVSGAGILDMVVGGCVCCACKVRVLAAAVTVVQTVSTTRRQVGHAHWHGRHVPASAHASHKCNATHRNNSAGNW